MSVMLMTMMTIYTNIHKILARIQPTKYLAVHIFAIAMAISLWTKRDQCSLCDMRTTAWCNVFMLRRISGAIHMSVDIQQTPHYVPYYMAI